MSDNKIYCDHCGRELDTTHDFDDAQIDMAHKWTTADLCADCLDRLYDLVCDFCKKQDHPTEKGGGEQ